MKYKLKAMSNTVVNLRTQEEYDEYGKMCDDVGWVWCSRKRFSDIKEYNVYGVETCIRVENNFSYADKDYYDENGYKIITLDELKSQLDYEYEVGDILVNDENDKFKILHEWNGYYITSKINNFDEVDQEWLFDKKDLKEFKLLVEPKEPEIKELSLKDIADKFNIPLDKLRIKE